MIRTSIHIDEVTHEKCEPHLLDGINHLLPQLSSHARLLTMDELTTIALNPHTQLFVALSRQMVMGMITLAVYPAPTGRKAWIEDLVVDSDCRGAHLGSQLLRHAISQAKAMGACQLMLTSRPARVVANEMYRKAGFLPKSTNVYVMNIE